MTSHRLCATHGCPSRVEGKAAYCEKCRRTRRTRAQQKYREHIRNISDPLLPGPPTSMAWLRSFSDWAMSGMSYAAYQSAARK